jgi:IS6 family transposase
VTAPGVSSAFAGFRFPREGDLGRGPLVPAGWPVLPGCRGAAGRARYHRRSRHRLPLGAAFHTGADRGGPARPARPCARWFAGETYLKVAGNWTYLCRAAGQRGQVIDVLLWAPRDLAAARHFFTRALRAGTIPAAVTTGRGHVYPRVPGELIPSALHTAGQDADNPVEAGHGRLKARLRPMRGLKRRRSARSLAAGHAFVQNLRRGHYDIATSVSSRHRLRIAFDDLAITIRPAEHPTDHSLTLRSDGTTQQCLRQRVLDG